MPASRQEANHKPALVVAAEPCDLCGEPVSGSAHDNGVCLNTLRPGRGVTVIALNESAINYACRASIGTGRGVFNIDRLGRKSRVLSSESRRYRGQQAVLGVWTDDAGWKRVGTITVESVAEVGR